MHEGDHPIIEWEPLVQEWFCPGMGLTADKENTYDTSEVAHRQVDLPGIHFINTNVEAIFITPMESRQVCPERFYYAMLLLKLIKFRCYSKL
jgi:hypothetical protein